MMRQSMGRRLARLEASKARQSELEDDDLLRVAGKTQEEAAADLLESCRRVLASCSADEREELLREMAESNAGFANKLRGSFHQRQIAAISKGP